MGRKPMVSRASISSDMRMAPISAVMRVPACAVNAIPAISGPITRTAPTPPMRPDKRPKAQGVQRRERLDAQRGANRHTRMSKTLIVPPSTMSAPLPQDISIIVANV